MIFFLARSGRKFDDEFTNDVKSCIWSHQHVKHIIVIMMGDNNYGRSTSNPSNEANHVISRAQRIVSEAEQVPNCHLVLLGLLPRLYTNEYFKTQLRSINDAFLKISQQSRAVTFLPIHKKFLEKRNVVRRGFHIPDGIHFNKRGSRLIADEIFIRLCKLPK